MPAGAPTGRGPGARSTPLVQRWRCDDRHRPGSQGNQDGRSTGAVARGTTRRRGRRPRPRGRASPHDAARGCRRGGTPGYPPPRLLELRVHERRRLRPFVDEMPNWLITLATARPGRRVASAGGPRPRPAHAATAWTWRWPFEHGSESLDAAGRSRRGRGQGGQGRRRGPPTARRPTEGSPAPGVGHGAASGEGFREVWNAVRQAVLDSERLVIVL